MDSDRKYLNSAVQIAQFVVDNAEFFDPDDYFALYLKLGDISWEPTDPSDTETFFDGYSWVEGTPQDFIAAASCKLLSPEARMARIQAQIDELDQTRTKLIEKLAEVSKT